MQLELKRIRCDGGTQPRTAIYDQVVNDYVEAMREGAVFPPVTVFYDGKDYWIADGFHRMAAVQALGLASIECEVRPGALSDAQWHSFSVNKSHGLRRTNEDKERAVKAALLHCQGRKSDREIARHIGVTSMMVATHRQALAAAGELPTPAHLSDSDRCADSREAPQGIAFDVNGVLQDGQHRLWAIALSGCTVPMNVTVNTPVDCIEYVGGGKRRMDSERMSLSGRFDGGVNKNQLATLRAMVRGLGADRKLPFCRTSDLLAWHKPAVDFAVSNLTTNRIKGVGSSTTRAVVARAWYSVDTDSLQRFCQVLRTGMAVCPVEGNIILLRDYLSRFDRSDTLSNLREQYGKVERALQAFLAGKVLSILRPCQTEIFPLPEEALA
ncbi:MAG TPA: ParB/RepB/Spo0J family partition protein [Phycisphaerae bacterium]|nr:ParB/RepB/Spo0J family partition protein [Phycisphaerae bacterium]